MCETLGTKVSVGHIDIRFFNRLIVDDLLVYDQQQKKMLRAGRVSASIDLLPLFEGEVSISSAQLFGMQASIYRADANSPLNCQFVIDSLASKDTASHTHLNLSIGSLIIRHGAINYDQWDKPQVRNAFSPYHVSVTDLSSHIILYKLTDDLLNVSLNKFSLNEASGLRINNLKTDIIYSPGNIRTKAFHLLMPETNISIPLLSVNYKLDNGKLQPGSLRFKTQLHCNSISPKDFSAFLSPTAVNSLPNISLSLAAKGTDKEADVTLKGHSLNDKSLSIDVHGTLLDFLSNIHGKLLLTELSVSENLVSNIASEFSLPDIVKRLGGITAAGSVQMFSKSHLTADAKVSATKVGSVVMDGTFHSNRIKAHVKTPQMDIAHLLNNSNFGTLRCDVDIDGTTTSGNDISSLAVKGTIDEVTYQHYTYHNIKVDGAYGKDVVEGSVSILDPYVKLIAEGSAHLGRQKDIDATVELSHFSPSMLNISKSFVSDTFNGTLQTNLSGTSIDDITGTINLSDISIIDASDKRPDVYISNVSITSEKNSDNSRRIELRSDFADVLLTGDIVLTKIPQSFTNLIASELHSIPGLPRQEKNPNNFNIEADIKDIDFIKRLVDIPLDLKKPLTIDGYVNSIDNKANIQISAPHLFVSDMEFTKTELLLWTPESKLQTSLSTTLHDNDGIVSFSLNGMADDDNLHSVITWDNKRSNVFKGELNTQARFFRSLAGKDAIEISIPQSHFEVGDTIWNIHSQGINYEDGVLKVNQLAVGNDNQHVYINGTCSKSPTDTIVASLKDIDVSYILDLVNFHSVDFDGRATGKAMASSVFGDITARAQLLVRDFLFENGRMGDMSINATYSNATEQIDIDAVADDWEADGKTLISGFVSPQRNELDLSVKAQNTRMEFVQTFCESFMKDANLRANGQVRIFGPFSGLNMTGGIRAKGDFTITPTNCRYTLPDDSITFVPDDIVFDNLLLKDRYGNKAYLSGGVHHKNLGRISYDFTAKTEKLLAYDFNSFGDNTFYGKAVIGGSIGIHGTGNELSITADATTLDDSFITYNAASPDAIASQDFITWRSKKAVEKERQDAAMADTLDASERHVIAHSIPLDNDLSNSGNSRTNIRMHFNVNVTPTARLHLLMDPLTGDYVDLFGSGGLRIEFYNKGSLEIFGIYNVERGLYRMTVQNLLRRDFSFLKGGTIAFGGDPYSASLNMQAAYNLNSVSLADLNIGTSFKANNVPVTCLMNITGSPGRPNVGFGLNLPSLSSDARQMVLSVINSQDEMNQQVLYLLAVGRFYSQSDYRNNTGQGNLAMQSFLSGTLTQQFNNVLNSVIGKRNWSIGANITPGADGMSNAEYEGILSGKLLNNRLIFNGQFGYRDNINTNSQNFIGDFSLQYLLTPNGNISLKVYNQANDRYFTPNSLNTQGVGIVFQKEFGK